MDAATPPVGIAFTTGVTAANKRNRTASLEIRRDRYLAIAIGTPIGSEPETGNDETGPNMRDDNERGTDSRNESKGSDNLLHQTGNDRTVRESGRGAQQRARSNPLHSQTDEFIRQFFDDLWTNF